jgi:hypothetical protein
MAQGPRYAAEGIHLFLSSLITQSPCQGGGGKQAR